MGRTSWGAAAVGMDAANSQLGCPAVELELPAGLGRNKRKRSRCGTSLSAQLSEQIDVSSLANDNDANDPELPHKPMPDGRKCPTCFHKDDQWDPVEVQRVPPVYKLCWWGKSRCKKTGKSRGHHCGYCIKIWMARWRHRKVEGQNMTLELWQRQLSEEEGALERHHNLVKVVIKMIVDRGFNFGCHPNWEQADTEVLKLEKIEQVVVSRPGALFYPADDYLEAFPKGLDHHRRDGHYEGHLDGEEGFYVPQKGPVKVKYNSIQQSKRESTVDDGKELLTPDQLDVKAKDLLMDMSTGCNMAALGFKGRGVSDAQASSATAKASGAPPKASSAPPNASSVTAKPRSDTANYSTPKNSRRQAC